MCGNGEKSKTDNMFLSFAGKELQVFQSCAWCENASCPLIKNQKSRMSCVSLFSSCRSHLCRCCRHVCLLCLVMSSWCCRHVAVAFVVATSAATNARNICACPKEIWVPVFLTAGPVYHTISRSLLPTYTIHPTRSQNKLFRLVVHYRVCRIPSDRMLWSGADHVKIPSLLRGFHHVDLTVIVFLRYFVFIHRTCAFSFDFQDENKKSEGHPAKK